MNPCFYPGRAYRSSPRIDVLHEMLRKGRLSEEERISVNRQLIAESMLSFKSVVSASSSYIHPDVVNDQRIIHAPYVPLFRA